MFEGAGVYVYCGVYVLSAGALPDANVCVSNVGIESRGEAL